MGGSASSLKSTFLPSRDAPVPLSAVWNIFLTSALVTFNHDLVVGLFDTGNWFVRMTNLERIVGTVQIFPGAQTEVLLSTFIGPADMGPDVVTYTPPPSDIVSDFGFVPADPFADFPLV